VSGGKGTTLALSSSGGGAPRFGSSGPLVPSGPGSTPNAYVQYGAADDLSETDLSALDPSLAAQVVSMSFVDTDVREFARVLFSELLLKPYTVDPGVSGTVTLRTGGNVDGNAALALAREALAPGGNTILYSSGVYRVASSSRVGGGVGNARTFTLEYIGAEAAQRALQPLLQGRGEIIAAAGSKLSVRGDEDTLALAGSMLAAIDVDRFRSASFGLFPLKHGDATSVRENLAGLFQAVGVQPEAIIAIERMNAILVVANAAGHIDFASEWLVRLDQGAQNQRQVYVYQVQNREASELASLAQSIFSGRASAGGAQGQGISSTGSVPTEVAASGPSSASTADGGIRITSDNGSNTLVIWATDKEYNEVEQALRRLDTPLRQIYVEATIAEVRLSNELSRGVRWFMEYGPLGVGVSDAPNGSVSPSYPGFNFSFKVPNVQAVVSALEAHTDVRIVSSPQLTVVDRQTATIQVGDQVPIVTKTVQNSASGDNIIANDVSFRDTGVILEVTPQIRASGEVVLDITQEVSRVVPTTSSQINSPTISQRKVASTVMVADGTAIVLGGLMSSTEEDGGGGLPGTQKTLLEAVFGTSKQTSSRTELIVIIRPIILDDNSDMRRVVEEIAAKMSNVVQVEVD
jgi:general secretion pathway protein D